MRLYDLIRAGRYQSIAVMGLAKNTGKTVTMNQIIDESMEDAVPLGLTSIGRDGEKIDVVTRTDKPPIYAPAGTILATAEGTLSNAEAKLEVLKTIPFSTPMGDIVIARVRTGGNVELAGADSNTQIKATMDVMRDFGAGLILVDGALDRVTTASPAITDAAILATGAALHRDMDKTIERTSHLVEMFKLTRTENMEIHNLSVSIVEDRKIALIDDDHTVHLLPLKTGLDAGRSIASAVTDNTRAIVLGGALSSNMLRDITASVRELSGLYFIVGDCTKIFLQSQEYKNFSRRGGLLRVVNPANLLAVTVNSFSPRGYCYDAGEFLAKMGRAVSPLPVFDNYLCQAENIAG